MPSLDPRGGDSQPPADDSCAGVAAQQKPRRFRAAEAQAEEESRPAQFQTWLEHGSDDLQDAWVSVCSCAATHEVQDFKLVDVVEAIRGGRILVRNKWGEMQAVDLAERQAEVRRLYHEGMAEAVMLNNVTKRKIVEALGLNVAVGRVKFVFVQT